MCRKNPGYSPKPTQRLRPHQSAFARQEMANECTVLQLVAALPQWLHSRRKAHRCLVAKDACSDHTMQPQVQRPTALHRPVATDWREFAYPTLLLHLIAELHGPDPHRTHHDHKTRQSTWHGPYTHQAFRPALAQRSHRHWCQVERRVHPRMWFLMLLFLRPPVTALRREPRGHTPTSPQAW